MVCLHCGAETSVTNSRPQKRSNQVWRRRQCRKCGAIFTTVEAAQYGGAWAVRSKSGRLSPFSRDKLFIALYKSCGHRKTALNDASALADTAIKKLSGQISGGTVESKVIMQITQVLLNRFDKAASTHYRAFHKA